MTANQSNTIIKNPNTKKAIAILQKFAAKEAAFKAAEKEAQEAAELIKTAMIEADVPKIEINTPTLTGYITLAERTTYSAKQLDIVADEFLKKVLDGAKVKAQVTLTNELPLGVTESKTQYITKKFKTKD